MNDDELKMLLEQLDGDAELRPDRAADIRIAMLDELDRATGVPTLAVDRAGERNGPGRHKMLTPLLVAAVVALVVAGVAVLTLRDQPPAVSDRVPTSVPAVEPENYLRSCVNFQDATELDGDDWFIVLTRLDRNGLDDSEYRDLLAAALVRLALSSDAASFADDLRQAADDLRSGEELSGIIESILEIERSSSLAAGIKCLR